MSQYLGDGLFFEDDGYQIRLFTQRQFEVHEVFLDDRVLTTLLRAIEKSRDLKLEFRPLTEDEKFNTVEDTNKGGSHGQEESEKERCQGGTGP